VREDSGAYLYNARAPLISCVALGKMHDFSESVSFSKMELMAGTASLDSCEIFMRKST
jgi:hypothetical protein